MKLLLPLLLMLIAPVILNAQVKKMKPEKVEVKMKKKNVVLLDVRTDAEFAEGHLPKALHADVLMEEKFMEQLSKLDPSKIYIVYCRSGKRSQTAATMMLKQGFKRVYSMEGGILAWKGQVVTTESQIPR